MANWCSTLATVFQNLKEDMPDNTLALDKVYATLATAWEQSEGDLYQMLSLLGADAETCDVGTVHSIKQIWSQNKKFKGIEMNIESKWNPPDIFLDKLVQAIIEMPKNELEWCHVYIADEPGNGIFVNTDGAHNFYTDVLGIDVQTDTYCDHIYFRYDEFDKAAEWILDNTGIKVSSFDDIADKKDKIESAFEAQYAETDSADNVYLFLEPYNIE